MSHRTTRLLAPAALVALLALSGCTSSDEPDAPAGNPSATAAAEQPAAAAATTSASLAEQTFDATAGDDVSGGTITTTLRALEVSGEAMTLRWAVRWDNDDAPDDATTHMFDLGIENMPTLTDPVNLKQYRPLCAEGSWQGELADLLACQNSALVSPSETVFFKFPNHATVEAWAVFPAPQDDDAVFEVLIAEGWPAFSGVRATTAP
ncbi:hypothetical protein [Cellulomonas chengniuliangii]|uniref:Lipoprotein n=1 Tax=Cellulomonas chengniuliangii TaxID=2968084 RepID=A0ABY5L2C1_9CELL|nr:hypothetical protein [Cellulomonas chengniuliangii]MCC2307532.1 hypothetical protein [Cellulomonas chengniuliangii]MCC2318644.1 hypothetical protein [Cellulomonas chengniuliangii]UUI75697.1 hypothetical protein NP064_01890 [Cellulomonas chengniuliangii]